MSVPNDNLYPDDNLYPEDFFDLTVQAKQISVSGTVPTELASAGAGDVTGMDFRIANRSSGTVFLGGQTVAGTTGYRLLANESVGGHLNKGEAIYGIATSGTVTTDIFSTGI